MPLKAMSKITLALPTHIDVETLWQHVDNRTVADTSKLFQSAHGLTRWKLNGPKGMQEPVGVVGRSASSRVFLWRTFADWRRMGNEIGIQCSAAAAPQILPAAGYPVHRREPQLRGKQSLSDACLWQILRAAWDDNHRLRPHRPLHGPQPQLSKARSVESGIQSPGTSW